MGISDGPGGMRKASVITTPLVVVSVVFPVLAAVSIHLRLIAKRIARQPLCSDDWWVIATWFLTFPMSVLFWVFSVKSGIDTYDINSVQGMYDSLELVITDVDPISSSWRGGRMRYDMTVVGLAQVGTSIALDVIVLCFPLPIIFRMLLSGKKKCMVFFMFWLGAL
ncbi:hypothetical protein Daus18300_000359 [Diaporthe australafricana]|uniref:Rhodopsin domain-containing protein n=1 Tax=Diaporthe australafricana TaxID=127596 RepID=A0ABR3Y5U5_9PEZI